MLLSNSISSLENTQDIADLIEVCELMADEYRFLNGKVSRNKFAQFFTSIKVANLISSLPPIIGSNLDLLEPGAGFGILSISLLDRILHETTIDKINLSTYEIDANIHHHLDLVLQKASSFLKEEGIELKYKNNNTDFLTQDLILLSKYDIIISNPPYFKLRKDHEYSQIFKNVIHGQPNIYIFFMALSKKCLKQNGYMSFITPRSFCSGLYFEKFRKWFLNNLSIEHIHSYKKRSSIFKKDNIEQENVVILYKNKTKQSEYIKISSSEDSELNNINDFKIKSNYIIYNKDHKIIRIPVDLDEVSLLKKMDCMGKKFSESEYFISTGPIVDFRNREYIIDVYEKKPELAQLFWMNNFKNDLIVHPIKKKPQAILVCDSTIKKLLPKNNYVLLKRVTSKEQKNRIQAATLFKKQIVSERIGLDNKINYISKKNSELSEEEAMAISYYFNNPDINCLFKMMNGTTQVNAYDIRMLPFPSEEKIKMIGKEFSLK